MKLLNILKCTLRMIYKSLVYIALLITLIIALVIGVILSPALLIPSVRKAKSYKSFMLFVIAFFACKQINSLSFLYTLLKRPQNGYAKLWMNMAISEDQTANVKSSVPFNDMLLSDTGKCIVQLEFGNPDETISSNIGEAVKLSEVSETHMLSKLGKDIDKMLNFIDPNHSIKSIETDEI